MKRSFGFHSLILSCLCMCVSIGADPVNGATATIPPEPAAASATPSPTPYVLGPDDQIVIQGANADDIVNKPMRIDLNGDVDFPMLGVLHAGGLTVPEFTKRLNEKASTYIRSPQLVVSVTEFKSQPISVLGSVTNPGTYQLQGQKRLLEMISVAGGLRPDAGHHLTITRSMEWGALPLFGTKEDPSGRYSTAEIDLNGVMNGARPADNIPVMPHDVISIPHAEMVYVAGEVKKPGGYVLGESDSISVIQALSLAEGVVQTADTKNARIIRHRGDQRVEIALDISKVLKGKSEDLRLQGQDILFIPDSSGKKVAIRAIEAAIQTGTGIAIWHR